MNHHHSSSAADVITLLLFVLFTIIPNVTAQPSPTNDDPYRYQRFSPSMAIIIVVLIFTLFVMGFFSIYIRHCSQPESVRGANGSTGRSRRGAAARGLDAAIIGTFPTLEYKVVKGLKIGKGALECAVCLNEFEDDETLRLIPKCDHVFHPECIDEWLASHTTCPVCRANLSPQAVDAAAVVDVAELTTSNTTTTRDHQTDVESGQHDQLDREECNDDSSARSVHNNATTEPDVLNVNEILNRNRTRGSSRSSRFMRLFPRSHSTGHSILVQPGEDTERFTLRLPVEVRKQIMNRELHRSTSVVELPRGGSSRRGPRMGDSGGNNRVRSFKRLEPSDRWVFSRAPSFLTRMLSMTSSKVASNGGEGTSAEPTKSGSVHLPV